MFARAIITLECVSTCLVREQLVGIALNNKVTYEEKFAQERVSDESYKISL